jgi:hypothetical protein
MAFEITQGKNRICKDSVGGLKNAYLAPYKKVLRSEIIYDKVSLTQFPQTFIYKFELVYGNTFDQQQNSEDGGKFFNQNISLSFSKLSAFDNLQFQKLLRKDYFIIGEDWNGNYFLFGFRNGLVAEKLDSSTDQQYQISFNSQEEEIAPFCNDLINTDFIIVDGYNKVFQDDYNFIFQNDFNYIFM